MSTEPVTWCTYYVQMGNATESVIVVVRATSHANAVRQTSWGGMGYPFALTTLRSGGRAPDEHRVFKHIHLDSWEEVDPKVAVLALSGAVNDNNKQR